MYITEFIMELVFIMGWLQCTMLFIMLFTMELFLFIMELLLFITEYTTVFITELQSTVFITEWLLFIMQSLLFITVFIMEQSFLWFTIRYNNSIWK